MTDFDETMEYFEHETDYSRCIVDAAGSVFEDKGDHRVYVGKWLVLSKSEKKQVRDYMEKIGLE